MGPGEVIGNAGAGLVNAKWAASKDVASKGLAAEKATGAILDACAQKPGGATVLHHVIRPGLDSDIDHIVVAGNNVYLLDSKCWKPGMYVTGPRGKVYRSGHNIFSWTHAPHVPQPGVGSALNDPRGDVEKHLRSHGVEAKVHPMRYVVWPSTEGRWLNTAFLKLDTLSPSALARFMNAHHVSASVDVVRALRVLVGK